MSTNSRIIDLLSSGRYDSVINELKNSNLKEKYIQRLKYLVRNLSRIEDDFTQGMITYETSNVERNKGILRILTFLSNVQELHGSNLAEEYEKECWESTLNINSIDKYQEFIESFPFSEYVKGAINKIHDKEKEDALNSRQARLVKSDQLFWERTIKRGTAKAYFEYLNSSSLLLFEKEAANKVKSLEDIFWNSVKLKGSESSLLSYKEIYPNGKFLDEMNLELNAVSYSIEEKEFKNIFDPNNKLKNSSFLPIEFSRMLFIKEKYEEFANKYPVSSFKQESEKRFKKIIESYNKNIDSLKIALLYQQVGWLLLLFYLIASRIAYITIIFMNMDFIVYDWFRFKNNIVYFIVSFVICFTGAIALIAIDYIIQLLYKRLFYRDLGLYGSWTNNFVGNIIPLYLFFFAPFFFILYFMDNTILFGDSFIEMLIEGAILSYILLVSSLIGFTDVIGVELKTWNNRVKYISYKSFR